MRTFSNFKPQRKKQTKHTTSRVHREKCKRYVRSGKINKKKKQKTCDSHQATLFQHFLLTSDNSELSQAPSCGSEAAVLFSCLY